MKIVRIFYLDVKITVIISNTDRDTCCNTIRAKYRGRVTHPGKLYFIIMLLVSLLYNLGHYRVQRTAGNRYVILYFSLLFRGTVIVFITPATRLLTRDTVSEYFASFVVYFPPPTFWSHKISSTQSQTVIVMSFCVLNV